MIKLTEEQTVALEMEAAELRKWKRQRNCGRGRRKDIIKRLIAINRLLNPPDLTAEAKKIGEMESIFEEDK